jgi:hypothetical protein
MSFQTVIHGRLHDETSADDRIYLSILPEENPLRLPAVTFHQISTTRTHAMGGDVPVQRVRVQVDSWGAAYAEARDLAGDVLSRLSRFRGTIEGATVLDCVFDLEGMAYESDTQLWRVSQDFTLYLQEV